MEEAAAAVTVEVAEGVVGVVAAEAENVNPRPAYEHVPQASRSRFETPRMAVAAKVTRLN